MKKIKFSLPRGKVSKRLLAGAGALVILAAAFFFTPQGQAVMAAALKRDLPIYCVQKENKVVSLTFDAAWGNEDTQALIDIFQKYKIQATFFVVGGWVDKYPESVKALHDAGHEVMNHSDTHSHFARLSSTEIIADINACNDKIEKVTGVRPTLFRAPYGEYTDQVIASAREAGVFTIQWNIDSLDWKKLPANEIQQRVLDRIQPGSIILFHNAAENTPAALPGVIEALIQKGYSFAPVSKLILTDNFEIDHTGKQIPKICETTTQPGT